MIAVILGGAPSVWRELAEAQALLNRRHLIVAANLAGIHHAGRLDGWATLHPDLLPGWAAKRAGRPAGRIFTPPTAPERWPGSSGLYALQCALFEMGATAAILCGVPMDSEAGHFSDPGRWAGTFDYRQAFATALPEIGGRVRSMGGWTAQTFGRPTPEWVSAVDNITPLGVTAAPEIHAMHQVTNTSKGTQSFWARNPDGSDRRVHLGPGDIETCEINTDDPTFAGSDLSVSEVAPTVAAHSPLSGAPTVKAKPFRPLAEKPATRRGK